MRQKELKNAIALIEKRKLAIERNRTMLNFELAFFFPLFAILFIMSYLATDERIKVGFYIFTIAIIVIDLFYSVAIYVGLNKKQRELENAIDKKLLK